MLHFSRYTASGQAVCIPVPSSIFRRCHGRGPTFTITLLWREPSNPIHVHPSTPHLDESASNTSMNAFANRYDDGCSAGTAAKVSLLVSRNVLLGWRDEERSRVHRRRSDRSLERRRWPVVDGQATQRSQSGRVVPKQLCQSSGWILPADPKQPQCLAAQSVPKAAQ